MAGAELRRNYLNLPSRQSHPAAPPGAAEFSQYQPSGAGPGGPPAAGDWRQWRRQIKPAGIGGIAGVPAFPPHSQRSRPDPARAEQLPGAGLNRQR